MLSAFRTSYCLNFQGSPAQNWQSLKMGVVRCSRPSVVVNYTWRTISEKVHLLQLRSIHIILKYYYFSYFIRIKVYTQKVCNLVHFFHCSTSRENCYTDCTPKKDRKCTYNVTWRCIRLTIVAMEKRLCINPLNAELNPICHLLALLGAHHILHVSRLRVKYSECMSVAVIIQHEKRMRWVILSSVSYLAVPHFFRITS